MPIRLDTKAPGFAGRFQEFLAGKREIAEDVEATVRKILADVAAGGDRALIELSRQFDRVDLQKLGLHVGADEIEAAAGEVDPAALDALKFARDRIEAYHARQLPSDEHFVDPLGVELSWRWSAIEAVGLYVPGGTAAYPSSVLMNAVPAGVAGVPRIVMTVPAPDGELNALVLAAAELAGVHEIYRIGGAQAIAALAYGTETIAPVAKKIPSLCWRCPKCIRWTRFRKLSNAGSCFSAKAKCRKPRPRSHRVREKRAGILSDTCNPTKSAKRSNCLK